MLIASVDARDTMIVSSIRRVLAVVDPARSRHPLLLLSASAAIASLGARTVFITAYGVRPGGDSPYYLATAAALAQSGPAGLARLDVTSAPLYAIGIATATWISRADPTWAAIAMQTVLGALTAGLLVVITDRVAGSRLAAGIAGAIGALHPWFLFWGAYVLSETVFLFALALCIERATALLRTRRPVRDAFLAALAVFVALLARSSAAVFAATLPVSVAIGLRGSTPRRLLGVAAGGALAAAVGLGLFVVTSGGPPGPSHVQRIEDYAWSAVHIGLQWTEEGRGTAGVDIIETGDVDHRAAVLAWFARDPTHFAVQALRKLKVFWTPVLPEFSLRHALLSLAFYVPFYLAAAGGIRLVARRSPNDVIFLLTGIASFTLTAMITFVDYDQRFRLPAELLLIPLVAAGAAPVLKAGSAALTTSWARVGQSARRVA